MKLERDFYCLLLNSTDKTFTTNSVDMNIDDPFVDRGRPGHGSPGHIAAAENLWIFDTFQVPCDRNCIIVSSFEGNTDR